MSTGGPLGDNEGRKFSFCVRFKRKEGPKGSKVRIQAEGLAKGRKKQGYQSPRKNADQSYAANNWFKNNKRVDKPRRVGDKKKGYREE